MTNMHITLLRGKALRVIIAALSLGLALGLAGCGGEPEAVVEPQVTPTATSVPSPDPTPTSSPANTPAPGISPTPSPTSTPVPDPTAAQPPTATPGEARSDKERITNVSVSDSDLVEIVGGNTAFAFDLYHALSEQGGNLFYSPYSISAALVMTYAGARGETERQMADTLDYRLPQNKLHPAFNALDLKLATRGEGEEGFRLNIANAIWGQAGYRFMPDFLDVLALNYGAGLRSMSFAEAPEDSRKSINDWVEERTEDRIRDLIPQGAIDEATRLVLTNAIYFNAAWLNPFPEGATGDRAFHLLDGTAVQTPMMTQTASFGYLQGVGYQAIDLPYKGEEMSMTILLPDEGNFGSFEAALDADRVISDLKRVRPERLELTMPLFEYESQASLRDALRAMGMADAFSASAADFSGMDGRRCAEAPACLVISDVFHKAFVSVDEEGTEAAAATGVLIGVTSLPPQVVIDRPFIFLIRDTETGAILFVGRVVDPRS